MSTNCNDFQKVIFYDVISDIFGYHVHKIIKKSICGVIFVPPRVKIDLMFEFIQFFKLVSRQLDWKNILNVLFRRNQQQLSCAYNIKLIVSVITCKSKCSPK